MSPSPATAPGLARRIYECAHLTGEFRLRSGVLSGEYFDKYLFESDPALLREVARRPAPGGCRGDRRSRAGRRSVGDDGLPAQRAADALLRKQAKDYGTCRLAEGGEVEGRRLPVVEDVVTSGGQLIESCAALREQGADIVSVLCVIDREAGGAENLASEGLELRSVFIMSQLHDAASV